MRSAAKRARPSTVQRLKKSRHKKRHALVAPKFEVLANGAHAVTIPIHTKPFVNGSQGNTRVGQIVRARLKAEQREVVLQGLFGIGISFRGITMVRLAPPKSKGLDPGNLWNALKAVQDEIAAHLGIDDGPQSPASWDVAQERAEAYGVRVEFRNERAKSRDELEEDLAYWKQMYLSLTNQVRRVELATEMLRGHASAMGEDDRKAQGLREAANDIDAAIRGAA